MTLIKKDHIYLLALLGMSVTVLFSSCKGCVKDTSKKITEITMSAAEGVAEALDENGASLAEKTADAASSIALGLGRSLDKQLDQHAEQVASVGGRTIVQAIDGLADGLSTELKEHYENIPFSKTFCDGVELDYIARFKEGTTFDTYLIIDKAGTYNCKFDFYDTDGNIFLTKEAVTTKQETDSYKYTLVSFALSKEQMTHYESNFKEVKVTVTKS